MKTLTKKTTILFPPKLYKRLERAARQYGCSVGDLVRNAVETHYGSGGSAARLKALEILSRLAGPTGEPQELEEQILKSALER
jgi:hypothetical protein